MTAVVEARFAGGPIAVELADFNGRAGVTVAMPGERAGMWPDEARAFAAALVVAADAADAAERPASLRRPASVDEQLRGLDE